MAVLLGHRGAEVHPEPRLRRDAPRRSNNESAGRPHQPVGPGQLVRDRPPEGRAPLRQGRRRRRGGRRGDPARVRPCDPRSRRTSSSRPRRPARSARASATTGPSPSARRREARRPSREPLACVAGLGLDVLHDRRAALPAARRHEPALPGGPRRRGARRRPDLVTRAVGHPQCAREREGRHRHPPRASSTSTGSSMPTLASSTVAAARSLYGNAAANAVTIRVPGARNPDS